MKTFTLAAPLIAACIFASCSKNDAPERTDPVCQLQSNVRIEEGVVVDSFNYAYNGNGQLIKVSGNNYDYTLGYDGGRVTRRTYFYAGTENKFASDTVFYNAGGTISEIKRVDEISRPVQNTRFQYTGNKLTSILFFDKNDVLRAQYNYVYTINNLTSITGDESWGGINRSFSYKMVYDTRHNIQKKGQQALLHDGYLGNHMGVSVIYVLSDNYVKTIEQNGLTVAVSYSLDENKNVTGVTLGSMPITRGTYQCR